MLGHHGLAPSARFAREKNSIVLFFLNRNTVPAPGPELSKQKNPALIIEAGFFCLDNGWLSRT